MKYINLSTFCFLYCILQCVHLQDTGTSSYLEIVSNRMYNLAENFKTKDNSSDIGIFLEDISKLAGALNKRNILDSVQELLSLITGDPTVLQTNSSLLGSLDVKSLSVYLPQLLGDVNNWNVSQRCLTDIFGVFTGLISRKKSSLRMLDASFRVPAGLMDFNLDWRGSFDECVAIKPPDHQINFQGQYCTGVLPIPFQGADALSALVGSVALQIGLCVPDTCSGDDIKIIINNFISLLPLNDTRILNGKKIEMQSATCQNNNLPYETKAIVMLVVGGIFVITMFIATIYDITMIQWPARKSKKKDQLPLHNGSMKPESVTQKDNIESNGTDKNHATTNDTTSTETNGKVPEKNEVMLQQYEYQPGLLGKLLLSFSVYSNGMKILDTNQAAGSLTALNGIRFFSMSWVILGHTFALGQKDVVNMATFYPALISRLSFHAILNATLSVDSFFALSGLLLTYLAMKGMKRNKKHGKWSKFWFMFYFHRFWRLTPPYMLVLGMYAALSPYFYNGPKYPQELGFIQDRENCEKYWWTNLLYVNNLVHSDKMCFGWSWYLANDMQFFVISPVMLVPLFFFPTAGVIITCLMLLATTVVTGVLNKINHWPPSVTGGGVNPPTNSQGLDYYVTPYCRMGPYIVGMFIGYILFKTDCKLKLNRYVNMMIWAAATVFACLVLYGLYRPFNGHPMGDDMSSLYVATHRSVWGACVGWVVLACATGNGGFINTFLSWKAFLPLSRLCYTAYLVHPIIIYVYSDSLRVSQYWTDLTIIYLFLGHLIMSNGVAFVVSLAFESPMMGLEKILLTGKQKKT